MRQDHHKKSHYWEEFGNLIYHGSQISKSELLSLGKDHVSYIRFEEQNDLYLIHIYSADGRHLYVTENPDQALQWLAQEERTPVALH